jgi:hypothetical protein
MATDQYQLSVRVLFDNGESFVFDKQYATTTAAEADADGLLAAISAAVGDYTLASVDMLRFGRALIDTTKMSGVSAEISAVTR